MATAELIAVPPSKQLAEAKAKLSEIQQSRNTIDAQIVAIEKQLVELGNPGDTPSVMERAAKLLGRDEHGAEVSRLRSQLDELREDANAHSTAEQMLRRECESLRQAVREEWADENRPRHKAIVRRMVEAVVALAIADEAERELRDDETILPVLCLNPSLDWRLTDGLTTTPRLFFDEVARSGYMTEKEINAAITKARREFLK